MTDRALTEIEGAKLDDPETFAAAPESVFISDGRGCVVRCKDAAPSADFMAALAAVRAMGGARGQE